MPSKFATENENVFQLLGTTLSPRPTTGAPPGSRWEIRPRGVVPLRHLRHVPPDSIVTVVKIVYRTELTVSLCA